jgi:protein SCO1
VRQIAAGASRPQIWQGAGVPGRRVLIAMVVILLAAVIPAVFVPTLACRPADPQLRDDLPTVPAFSLVDERGQVFTEEALRGHPTVVDFIFTRCDNICPVMSERMHGIQEKTFDLGQRFKLLSFTVDPAYDTPAVLAEYAKQHQADDARWRFVTGPIDKLKPLIADTFMNSMKVTGALKSGAPEIGHTGFFVLVDANLKIRGVYDSGNLSKLDEVMRDARFLIRTQR